MTTWKQLKVKIGQLAGSLRFWIVSLTFVTMFLSGVDSGGFSFALLLDIIEKWLASIVAIGTLDSVATKAGESFGKARK